MLVCDFCHRKLNKKHYYKIVSKDEHYTFRKLCGGCTSLYKGMFEEYKRTELNTIFRIYVFFRDYDTNIIKLKKVDEE